MKLSTLYALGLSARKTIGGLRKRRWMFVVALTLCFLGFVVRANKGLPESRHPPKARAAASSVSRPGPLEITDASGKRDRRAAQVAPSPRIRAVYFRITSLGIEPTELTLPAGRYLVAIDNDSGFNALDVMIDKEGGPRLGNAQLPSGRRKWREFVDFTPGRHILTDPNDTKRVCRLTITDQ
jgi:hypothetical protein